MADRHGAARGVVLNRVGADSMAAREEFFARNWALGEPPPLIEAMQAGVLSVMEVQVSVIYDV